MAVAAKRPVPRHVNLGGGSRDGTTVGVEDGGGANIGGGGRHRRQRNVASAPNRLWPNLTGATILATGVWSWWLLGRNADWMPALRWVILGMGAATLAPLKAIRTRWSAAINGSSAAAGLELPTGTAVMAIGGFSAPTRLPHSATSRPT